MATPSDVNHRSYLLALAATNNCLTSKCLRLVQVWHYLCKKGGRQQVRNGKGTPLTLSACAIGDRKKPLPTSMRFYKGYGYQRIIYERLTEPLHLNIASVFVKLFGSFSAKAAFDVTERRSYAYGILETARIAKRRGLKRITVAEFGVASGAGLLAMCRLAKQATALTGVQFNIVGFDSGTGLPPPANYRDHPDLWV